MVLLIKVPLKIQITAKFPVLNIKPDDQIKLSAINVFS